MLLGETPKIKTMYGYADVVVFSALRVYVSLVSYDFTMGMTFVKKKGVWKPLDRDSDCIMDNSVNEEADEEKSKEIIDHIIECLENDYKRILKESLSQVEVDIKDNSNQLVKAEGSVWILKSNLDTFNKKARSIRSALAKKGEAK